LSCVLNCALLNFSYQNLGKVGLECDFCINDFLSHVHFMVSKTNATSL